MNEKPININQYILSFPVEVQKRLNTLSELTKNLVPEAVESFSYGMVAFKYKNKPLVYFGGFSKHIGFYATPTSHTEFNTALANYKQGKGSVQFPLNEALPLDIIQKIILFKANHIDTDRKSTITFKKK